ncbi:MAG: class I SAM-dependent methyltransferase [Candidatus Woesearchaeota archaeon]|nr:class I SAM-dependent methyltransferase [Candidatus Woesearchaeota archaeon]
MSYKTLSRLKNVVSSLGRGRFVLNVGCSEGYYDTWLMKRFSKVIGIDMNMNDLIVAKRRNPGTSYILASAAYLPFKEKVFDEVICVDVLEHVKEDSKAVFEIGRVLKKGKNLIVTVPNMNFPFSYDPVNRVLMMFGKKLPIGLWGFGHLRLYSEQSLKDILSRNSFKVTGIRRMLHFFCGIFENYYLVNLLQPFTKHDSKNLDRFYHNKNTSDGGRSRLKESLIEKNPPKILTKIRDIIMSIDSFMFRESKKSLGLLAVAEKI